MLRFCSRRIARTATLAFSFLTFVALAFLLAPEVRSGDNKTVDAVPGEYVVLLRNSNLLTAFQAQLSELGFETVEKLRPNTLLIRIVDGSSLREARTALRVLNGMAMVEVAEPNFIYRASKLPSDPDLGKLWGLKNTGSQDTSGARGIVGIDIGAEMAWDIQTGSKSVVVAVIDTGIDFSHPELKSQAWENTAEKEGLTGVDDDGNGYVDDINGYNFANNKGDSSDDQGHGTHCAGTIGAKGDDGFGVAGVNWDVSLMALKFLDKSGSGSLANAVKAIDYGRQMGANIMSNSWGGGGFSAVLKKAIEDANTAGILFVAAAGNEASNNDLSPAYPANYEVDNVLSVAAIDNRGELASFSNYGALKVHVAAPGVNIVSTVPGAKYESLSGTSMATPHVSGIAALVLSQFPGASPLELKKRIMDFARPLYTLKNRVASKGMADAFYALSGQTPPEDPNDPSKLPNSKVYSLESEHPYKENAVLEHRIHIPGAKKLAVKFARFETEPGYDTVSFHDAAGALAGALSGKQDAGVTSPVIHGDTVTVKFRSDETVNAFGFIVESVLYE